MDSLALAASMQISTQMEMTDGELLGAPRLKPPAYRCLENPSLSYEGSTSLQKQCSTFFSINVIVSLAGKKMELN